MVNGYLDTDNKTPEDAGQSISANIGNSLVEEVSPLPPDADFRLIGLTERQIRLLAGQPNYIRQEVYEEALRLLMERDAGSDNLSDFLAT